LIAAKRGKEILAPVLYEGTTTASWFNQWIEEHLCGELSPNSTIILDNARFHIKKDVDHIAKVHGHKVIFLPPYSPDFNPIEQVFADIKKKRSLAPENTTIDNIIEIIWLIIGMTIVPQYRYCSHSLSFG
jgi:transposase